MPKILYIYKERGAILPRFYIYFKFLNYFDILTYLLLFSVPPSIQCILACVICMVHKSLFIEVLHITSFFLNSFFIVCCSFFLLVFLLCELWFSKLFLPNCIHALTDPLLGPKFNCQGCNRSYRSKAALMRHVKYDCGQPPRFVCRFCNKYRAYQKVHLLRHIHRNHKEIQKI